VILRAIAALYRDAKDDRDSVLTADDIGRELGRVSRRNDRGAGVASVNDGGRTATTATAATATAAASSQQEQRSQQETCCHT
jgi:hypothetical protein